MRDDREIADLGNVGHVARPLAGADARANCRSGGGIAPPRRFVGR